MPAPSPKQILPMLETHLSELKSCTRCTGMIGPVVTGHPVFSPVFFAGQAPGPHEGKFGRPFAWTAGKTLFRWTETIGLDEAGIRSRVYMAAICRCFPGKTKHGGDRVPSPEEVAACAPHIDRELSLIRPRLVVPIGRLAIDAFFGAAAPLADIIGRVHPGDRAGVRFDLVPLPHPSGASTWWKMEPGATLLGRALGLIEKHPAWREIVAKAPPAYPVPASLVPPVAESVRRPRKPKI